jgi:hypothetical protein
MFFYRDANRRSRKVDITGYVAHAIRKSAIVAISVNGSIGDERNPRATAKLPSIMIGIGCCTS